MMLTAKPFSRTQPLKQRRTLAWILGITVLLLQLFLPSLNYEHWSAFIALLTLPIIAFCLHQLTSNAWVWNRLFRSEKDLDEYEIHARNAFIARAYTLSNSWMAWITFLIFIIGGGFLNVRFPNLNLFPNANSETASVLFFLIIVLTFQYLPRLVAAVTENETEE